MPLACIHPVRGDDVACLLVLMSLAPAPPVRQACAGGGVPGQPPVQVQCVAGSVLKESVLVAYSWTWMNAARVGRVLGWVVTERAQPAASGWCLHTN